MKQVGEIWGERLLAEYLPLLTKEVEPLVAAITNPLSKINYKTMPMPLIATLATKQEREATEKDIEDGYATVKSILDPIMADVVLSLREVREKIERTLSEHTRIGFHADL